MVGRFASAQRSKWAFAQQGSPVPGHPWPLGLTVDTRPGQRPGLLAARDLLAQTRPGKSPLVSGPSGPVGARRAAGSVWVMRACRGFRLSCARRLVRGLCFVAAPAQGYGFARVLTRFRASLGLRLAGTPLRWGRSFASLPLGDELRKDGGINPEVPQRPQTLSIDRL